MKKHWRFLIEFLMLRGNRKKLFSILRRMWNKSSGKREIKRLSHRLTLMFIQLMKTAYSSCLLLACFLLWACGEHPQKVEFKALPSDGIQSTAITIDTLSCNTFFSNPTSVYIINDSLLLTFDDNRGDKMCHIINTRKGAIMKSFGEWGKARSEFIYPQGAYLFEDSLCYIYDFQTRNNVCFSLMNILQGKPAVKSIIAMNEINYDEPMTHRFYKVYPLSQGRFIGFGNHPENRIQIFNSSKLLNTYSDYPILDETEENNWSIWGNMACFGVSPDEKHIVITTRIGAAFEILSLNGNQITHSHVRGFYKPEYDIAQGAKPACVIATPKTILGFNALHVTNDGFYAVLAGPENHYNELLKFNFDGECVHKYCFPDFVTDIACITLKNEILWGFIEDKENEIKLIKSRI